MTVFCGVGTDLELNGAFDTVVPSVEQVVEKDKEISRSGGRAAPCRNGICCSFCCEKNGCWG